MILHTVEKRDHVSEDDRVYKKPEFIDKVCPEQRPGGRRTSKDEYVPSLPLFNPANFLANISTNNGGVFKIFPFQRARQNYFVNTIVPAGVLNVVFASACLFSR